MFLPLYMTEKDTMPIDLVDGATIWNQAKLLELAAAVSGSPLLWIN